MKTILKKKIIHRYPSPITRTIQKLVFDMYNIDERYEEYEYKRYVVVPINTDKKVNYTGLVQNIKLPITKFTSII